MAQGFANEAVTIVEETVEGFGDGLMEADDQGWGE